MAQAQKVTPMMEHYLKVKEKHPDHILFYRLGDFYEMFFEDAKLVSRELQLTLTGKSCGLPERAPMCGIPYHAAEGYIKRLIDKGYKVAVCEQMEDPRFAKGLVQRDVIRIVTPGTITEDAMLDANSNNFLACIIVKKDAFGVCFADVSTGEVYLTQKDGGATAEDMINAFTQYSPSEVLFNSDFLDYGSVGQYLKTKLNCVGTVVDDDDDPEAAVSGLRARGIFQKLDPIAQTKTLAVISLYALMNYIDYTQRANVKRSLSLHYYQDDFYMTIDLTARRNLELTESMRLRQKQGTLYWVLDRTKTVMGRRFLKKAIEQPLLSAAEILRRQEAVAELVQDFRLNDDIAEALNGIFDMERLMTRVVYHQATPKDLNALAQSCHGTAQLKEIAKRGKSPLLCSLTGRLQDLASLAKAVEDAIKTEPPALMKDGGYIKDGFDKQLDEYRYICDHAKEYLAQMEAKEREKTGIKNLKIGFNRVFGYYIEVSKSNLPLVPANYVRKQTLTGGERYITEELKEVENKVLNAKDKALMIEADIYDKLTAFVAGQMEQVQQTSFAAAEIDFLSSLAIVARDNRYTRPEIAASGEITIKNGRHPVIEQLLNGDMFVPNDTALGDESKVMVITGPNMAGKSTYMRQVALIVIMAQIGSFVPAQYAGVTICDKVFTRVGASDDLAAGQSTFMVEMSEVAHILKNATPNSLVILDEIGRGTSTFDGMSIARAVVEYIIKNRKLGCKTLFATHYHELTELEKLYTGVQNYNIACKKRGDEIIFLRKIVRGGADDSYGVEVAKLAGVPNEIIRRAKEILGEIEAANHGSNRIATRPDQEEVMQMTFVPVQDNPLADRLKDVDVNALTPFDALKLLYELKEIAKEV